MSSLDFLRKGKLHIHLGSTLALTIMLYYAVQHSVTFADLTNAIATVPAIFWLIAWIFDIVVDTGKVYTKMAGKWTFLGAGLGFLVLFAFFTGVNYYLLIAAGAAAGATTVLTAMLLAFLIVMPKTGTSIWILYLYVASILVVFLTGGHPDVSLLPQSFRGGLP